ncbi:Lysophosphatidylcholine acyltransferase 2 [Perkinsus chesapeaki]|uniref:Lysophosphatidylcholine acyltransferase 2 n=1 Tax=Perkinsus chesapeaki TaxID=330153 RepID=A0A7J6MGV0_PERCH|nr:Lysophosphatidylcholine acyltransferase 2 [Perkinsus chesapeaki]
MACEIYNGAKFIPANGGNGRADRRPRPVCLAVSPNDAAKLSGFRLAAAAEGDSDWIGHKFRAPADAARPDILHQTLMQILDSEANKLGYIDDIIILLDCGSPTTQAVRVSSDFVVPRTYGKFSRCMAGALKGQCKVIGVDVLSGSDGYVDSYGLSDFVKYFITGESDRKIVFAMGVTSHTDPVLSAPKDMQTARNRFELRGEIDPADLGKFISPLLASPGDQVVLMASRARHIASVLEASLRCSKVEMVFAGPPDDMEGDETKRPETIWASLRVREGEKPPVDPSNVVKLRVSADTPSPSLGEKLIHQLEDGKVARLEAMGPIALARLVNGVAVAARRGSERGTGSLISRARGMRQKTQGGQFWAIELEVSLVKPQETSGSSAPKGDELSEDVEVPQRGRRMPSREFRPMMHASDKMQHCENRFTLSKDTDTQECGHAIAGYLREPGQMVVLQMIGPDACAKAVRTAAYLRQQYSLDLDLRFTTAPEGVVAYDKDAAEEIWIGMEVAEGKPPFTALVDFEISSKTFPDKLAWAVASHLFRGESMRLTEMYEGRKTDFSWATQITTRLQPTEEMRRIQENLANAEGVGAASLTQLDELARSLAVAVPPQGSRSVEAM